MLQIQSFEQFYKSLNDKERKEFQTQVYLMTELIKEWTWFDVPKSYESVYNLLNINCEETKEAQELDVFEVDFDKIDEEFDNCDSLFYTGGLNAEKIINSFATKYYYFAFNKIKQYNLSEEEQLSVFEKYSKPLVLEFNKTMKNCSSMIKENINKSTRKNFESNPYDRQIFTTFKLMDIDKNYLSEMAEKCQKLRNRKKSINNESEKQYIKKYVKKRSKR